MSETIQITLPKEIVDKAKERGVDIDEFKDTVQAFAIIDITAKTSKLSKEEAGILSKKIKSSAWKKIKNDECNRKLLPANDRPRISDLFGVWKKRVRGRLAQRGS